MIRLKLGTMTLRRISICCRQPAIIFTLLCVLRPTFSSDKEYNVWDKDSYATEEKKPHMASPTQASNYYDSPIPDAAQNSSTVPYLVLVVISRPEALHERMAIRRTWLPVTSTCQIKLIFAFSGHFKLKELRNAITEEKSAYSDIVQFDDLTDRYYETLELVRRGLDWARTSYPEAKFIGKATDDVWINFPRVIDLLKRPSFGKDFILGHFIDRSSEKTSELYEKFTLFNKQPLKFAVGHLWITPGYTLDKLLQSPTNRGPRMTSVADIVLTGEFRRDWNIMMGNIEDYADLWDLTDDVGCDIVNYTLVHGVFSQQKYEFASLPCLSSQLCSTA